MFNTIEIIKKKKPLIHNITNYVAINDVANIILAIGGKPMMAEYKGEMAEITGFSDGLNMNMGMLHPDKLEAMLIAGKTANQKGIPVVLDPVGCGGSEFRKDAVGKLINEIAFTAIKGNISEIKTIVDRKQSTRGVDVKEEDQNMEDIDQFIKDAANKLNCFIVVTGETDYVSDGNIVYKIHNGHPMMASVTGTGCALSGLLAAFLAAESTIESCAEAVIAMGYAGEIAYEQLAKGEGNLTYRDKIIDTIYCINDEIINKGAKYESQ